MQYMSILIYKALRRSGHNHRPAIKVHVATSHTCGGGASREILVVGGVILFKEMSFEFSFG